MNRREMMLQLTVDHKAPLLIAIEKWQESGELFIKQLSGFVIYVQQQTGTFCAEDAYGSKYGEKSLEALETTIRLHLAKHRRFKPVASKDATNEHYVTFTYPDNYHKDRSAHQSHALKHYNDDHGEFVLQTPSNMATHAEIMKRVDQIHALEQEIQTLRKSYTDEVTMAMLEPQEPT